MRNNPERSPKPVAVLIAYLIERLSYSDPTLKPFADGLRLTDTWGKGLGFDFDPPRRWNLGKVFNKGVLEAFPSQAPEFERWFANERGAEWAPFFSA
jgi:hypothetical protein